MLSCCEQGCCVLGPGSACVSCCPPPPAGFACCWAACWVQNRSRREGGLPTAAAAGALAPVPGGDGCRAPCKLLPAPCCTVEGWASAAACVSAPAGPCMQAGQTPEVTAQEEWHKAHNLWQMHEPTAGQYAALAHKGGTAREAGQTGGCTGLSEFKPEQHAAGCLSCPLAGWAGTALRN